MNKQPCNHKVLRFCFSFPGETTFRDLRETGSCWLGTFQLGRVGFSKNKTKMVEHKLALFATVVALWTLVALLIKLIRMEMILLKYILGKFTPFSLAAMLRRKVKLYIL